ncbi:hypothetical protein AAE478_003727 [Parahypoxylon ruwenzoriense]
MEVDSDEGSRRLALIRAVRSLDEDGTVALPDKIYKIWLLLSATKSTRLHGAEESILRWLFKQMSSDSESAEQVRRYPLTWTILGHVFPKIPAQALGRSLAYLRFVSVLNQTLLDITTARRKPSTSPSQTNGVAVDDRGPVQSRKRKRDDEFPSKIEDLRTPEGCIKSATEVFRALSSLFEPGDQCTGPSTSERRVGAEHVKTLFSSSNEETRSIAARLLLICDRSLSVLDHAISKDQGSWVGTVAALWNLRLHSKDDGIEFARHIYGPVCSILTRLRGVSGVTPVVTSSTVQNLWVRQLRQFLSASFIRPARQLFAIEGDTEVLRTALEVTKRNIGGSAIVMWDMVSRTPRDSSDPKSKAEHSSWAQNVFETLLDAVRTIESLERNKVVARLLDTAIQTDSVPNTPVLRAIYREHALGPDGTDWTLVSKIVACDADVFLMDDALIKDIFSRVGYSNCDAVIMETVVSEVILPLEDAFAKARNLSGFIQKWYDYLCESAEASLDQTTWFHPKIRQRLASILQSTLTSTQLLRALERLDLPDANNDANNGPLLVVLDGISAGITEEDFIKQVDPQIFAMAFKDNKDKAYENLSSSTLSLRWRIAGRMASRETSDKTDRLWAESKSILKRVLKKGPLSDPETFEAFSCCHKLWLANHPGGRYEVDLAKLTCSFLERISSKAESKSDLSTLQPHIDYVFRYLPKLAELPKREDNAVTNHIVDLFWHVGKQFVARGDTQLSSPLRLLLHNFDCEDEESLVDAFISQPLDVLDSAGAQSGWTQPQSLLLILIILELPREALTKGRRKRIMSSWKKWRLAIAAHASKNSQFAVAILRLLTRIMQQPTFYDGMEFDDLVYIASTMAKNDKAVHALIEKLIDLTLRQMVASSEGSSQVYFTDASKYVTNLELERPGYRVARVLLVKGLVVALHNSSPSYPYWSDVDFNKALQKLEQIIRDSLSEFASESKSAEATAENEAWLLELSATLGGAAWVAEARGERPIELPEQIIRQLESISASYMLGGIDAGWKLRVFLVRNYPHRYHMPSFFVQLEQASQAVDEDLVYALVDAFVKTRDHAARGELLNELVGSGKLATGPLGALLAVRRLVELCQGTNTPSSNGESQYILDAAVVHEQLASILNRADSIRHFKQLSDTLVLLLDRHANSMTQFNIEATLSSVIHVCSQMGPKIQGPGAAGEIYGRLYKLVALVLKRHRLRLTGHFPILLATLRALLGTLLADPCSSTMNTASSQIHPPWLELRLQARHAERFARLLTLICEPSAASVARSRPSELDSATDAAKRTAGQDMFTILELYIKLQLEVSVPRDIRKVLEPGVYSILNITPQGSRRVLNESLDANGRAIFRQMFTDYKKFGKWSGV